MNKTWTTKEGVVIPIKDMETSHIQNCIRIIEREINTAEESLAWCDSSEIGLYTATSTEAWLDEARKRIKQLKSELKKRT